MRSNRIDTIANNIIHRLVAGTTYPTQTGLCTLFPGYGWPEVVGINALNVQTTMIYNNSVSCFIHLLIQNEI